MLFKKTMDTRLLFNGEPVFIVIKKSRSKKIILKPNYKKRCCNVSIPRWVSFKQGVAFANQHLGWISSHLDSKNRQYITDLTTITLLGNSYTLQFINSKDTLNISSNNNVILIQGNFNNAKFTNFCKQMLKNYIINAVNKLTYDLNINYSKITIKDTETKWGGCSSLKNLSFNWRLIFAPKNVLDYVIAHEVAHLVHFNHSKDFWNLVQNIHPSYKDDKLWLKNNGKKLYRIIT